MAGLRVLICEDSLTYATGLKRMLEHDGDIAVTAVCETAEEAIETLERDPPGLITMDLELPGMGGLEAVEKIMASHPLPILVLSSHIGPRSDKAAAALAAGAIDVLAKNDIDLRDPAGAAGAAFRGRVKMLSRAHVIRHPRSGLGAPAVMPVATRRRAAVIGMCASTGGPQVLARVLELIPATFTVPILVVQHIAPGFTEGLAAWLGNIIAVPVRIAWDGAVAEPGVWIAPEDAHLKLGGSGVLSLDRHSVAGYHRPSGDVLLKSIAAATGRAGVAVVLTGMGRDGAAGAAEVRRHGGFAIAQDEASSAIFGMPKVAADLGVDLVLPPSGIAAQLLGLRHEPLTGAR